MKVTTIQETARLYRVRKRGKGNRTRVIGQIQDDHDGLTLVVVSQARHIHTIFKFDVMLSEGACCGLPNKSKLFTVNSRKTTGLCSILVTSQMARKLLGTLNIGALLYDHHDVSLNVEW